MRKTQKRNNKSSKKGGNSKSSKNASKKNYSKKSISDLQAAMHLGDLDKAIKEQEANIRSSKPLIVTDVNYHAKIIGENNLPVNHKRRVTVLRSLKNISAKNKK
jgi:hypothetical protein